MAAQLSLLAALPENKPSNAGITEIILSEFGDDQSAILLPMLAHLTNKCNDRWLTWIAPTGINKTLLQEYGFNLSRLRLIHPSKAIGKTGALLWDALANGCSHTVVCTAHNLTEQDCRQLENAAIQGNTRGLLLRNRQAQ